MTTSKYLVDSKMFELDRHYKECQKNNIPFIKARKNPVDGNYLVQLDLITCHHNLSDNMIGKLNDLFQKEYQFLSSKETTRKIFKGSNIDKQFSWFDGLLPERLDSFCEILFDLSEKPD